MGYGTRLFVMAKTLLGNSLAQVSVNMEIINAFWLSSSIRQGSPLAPLLYAVAPDGLNWLMQDRTNIGRMKSVTLGNGEQVCIEIFEDDSNALVDNEEISIAHFWECLYIFCKASGIITKWA